MGDLLGHGVRFGSASAILAVGEGIETILSLRSALPRLPCVAALSANHLAAFSMPEGSHRLYLARDDDPAGHRATEHLTARASAAGVDVRLLLPQLGDFNDDLRILGIGAVRSCLLTQMVTDDVRQLDVG